MSKVVIDRAVVEQALKALEKADRISGYRNNWAEILCLRAALEQPQAVTDCHQMQPQVEQRPVAYEFYNPVTGHAIVDYSEHTHVGHLTADKGYITTALYAHTQSQHGQIALNHAIEIECQKCGSTEKGILAFTLHPQPPRQPLTEQQIAQAVRWLYQDHRAAGMGLQDDIAVARAIEAAHGIGGEK